MKIGLHSLMLKVKVDFKSRTFWKAGKKMKIGELAGRGGVNASAIRYYEQVGLLPAPSRRGGQRLYSPGAVDRVLLIRFAGDMGFTLSEIRLFLNGLRDQTPVGPRWQKLARHKLKEVEETIERSLRLQSLLKNLLHCRCGSLKVCVECLSLSPELPAQRRRKRAFTSSRRNKPQITMGVERGRPRRF
jgi:MerR family redox-sensitive transcriptional activator SoxR